MIDGPTLRALRESKGVPMRKVARVARMSHGHLSKVERGEHGRPVTPAVLTAYERATGVPLTSGETNTDGWRLGQLSPHGRRAYLGKVGAFALGGDLPDPIERTLDQHRTEDPPHPTVLEVVIGTLESLGAAGGPVAFAVLRLAVRYDPDPRLVARLARVAAAGAVATQRYDTARALHLVALHGAATADDPDLRALVLADIAQLHWQFDAPGDALTVLRIAEVDDRVSDTARKVLGEVRATVGQIEQRVRETIART